MLLDVDTMESNNSPTLDLFRWLFLLLYSSFLAS